MRGVIAGSLVTALPLLVAVGLIAAPKPKAAATLQVPLTGQAIGADGRKVTINAVATVTIEDAAPTPTPDPVTISYVTGSPNRLTTGSQGSVTVILTHPVTTPLRLMVKVEDAGMSGPTSVDIPAGADRGSFTVQVGAGAITAERYANVSVVYGATSRYCTFILQPAPTPTPLPVPGPLGPVTPQVEGVTLPDGTPLPAFIEAGQQVRIFGSGFGAKAGEVWVQGYPLAVDQWSDTEALATVLLPSPALGFDLRTKEGGSYGASLPNREMYLEAMPPSARRH